MKMNCRRNLRRTYQQVGTVINFLEKKWVSYLYRTAQPPTLASFRTWGSSAGAGRIRLTRRKSIHFEIENKKRFLFTRPNLNSKNLISLPQRIT